MFFRTLILSLCAALMILFPCKTGQAAPLDNARIDPEILVSLVTEATKNTGVNSLMSMMTVRNGLLYLFLPQNPTKPFDVNLKFIGDIALSSPLVTLSEATTLFGYSATHNISAVIDENRSFERQLIDRLQQPSIRTGLWMKGYGRWDVSKINKGLPGYDYSANGVVIGYDFNSGGFTAGGAYARTDGSLKEKEIIDDNKMKSDSWAVYAGYRFSSGFFSDVYGLSSRTDNEMAKFVNKGWLQSDFMTKSYLFGFRIGHTFKFDHFSLLPSIGLSYQKAENDDYVATGSLYQIYSGFKSSSQRLPVRLEGIYHLTSLDEASFTLSAHAGYAYEFRNKGVSGNMSYVGLDSLFYVEGVKPGEHAWSAGAGVRYEKNLMGVSLAYLYEGRKEFEAHQVTASLELRF